MDNFLEFYSSKHDHEELVVSAVVKLVKLFCIAAPMDLCIHLNKRELETICNINNLSLRWWCSVQEGPCDRVFNRWDSYNATSVDSSDAQIWNYVQFSQG